MRGNPSYMSLGIVAALALAACACSEGSEPVATEQAPIVSPHVARVLGFENPDDWIVTGKKSSSDIRIEGQHSLAVDGGYVQVRSVSLDSLGSVDSELTLALRVPPPGTSGWQGTVGINLDSPSLGFRSVSLGEQSLGRAEPGKFHQFSFPMSSSTRDKLARKYNGLHITVILNLPHGRGDYLLDRLSVAAPLSASLCAPGGQCAFRIQFPHDLPEAKASFVGQGEVALWSSPDTVDSQPMQLVG